MNSGARVVHNNNSNKDSKIETLTQKVFTTCTPQTLGLSFLKWQSNSGFFQWPLAAHISPINIGDIVGFDLLHKSLQQKIWFVIN